MKLLEYQAKHILKKHGIPIPEGILVRKNEDPAIRTPVVLKSQVPVGGRGKAGGIVIVKDTTELKTSIVRLFNLQIQGHLPVAILAEELIPIKKEFYLALLIDRSSGEIQLLAHSQGGIEVEGNASQDFLHSSLSDDFLSERAKNLAVLFSYDEQRIATLLKNLFQAFVDSDATLLEINPLILSKSGQLLCGDCKIEIDDASLFRHAELMSQPPPDANFVKLNERGSVATIANGAGLAMATVDAVADFGMTPANFLDIGGGATTASVLRAFSKIMEFPNIKAIVINIFAGITRCDEIAKAIVEARANAPNLPPLFIRLAGTNFEEAVQLLAEHEIPRLASLEECLLAARKAVHG
ncbi:MAG TPA: succinate--CoA ligase subunit beta [Candidatus Saccharimonadales bacterium]|nr:succinate--CoA ligase subunit beta [Candidatus Saccharimonadales bacterium]